MVDQTVTGAPVKSADQKSREAYFTASQMQLVWARFKKNRAAMIAGMVLITITPVSYTHLTLPTILRV